MSHSLHRYGNKEDLSNDYCIYARISKKINGEGGGVKLQRIYEIFTSEDFVNYGSLNAGCSHLSGLDDDEYKRILLNSSGIIVTYSSLESVRNVLKKLKEENLGVSIVVSGLIDETVKTAHQLDLKPHTAVLSLGVYGNTKLLPDEDTLKITTMCGHSLISSQIVQKAKLEVCNGQCASKAAMAIERPCTCGIFNIQRCSDLLNNTLDNESD